MDYFSQVVKAANSGQTIPQEPEWNVWIHQNTGKTHCETCLKLHECWFAKELTPKWPHHPFCHCILEDIPYVNVMYNCTADSAYSKYDVYLFNTKGKYSNDKKIVFESWGYTVEDIPYLKQEIEKQGLQKYINGDYILHTLDEHGQHINIRIEIPRKDGSRTASFITAGWLVPTVIYN